MDTVGNMAGASTKPRQIDLADLIYVLKARAFSDGYKIGPEGEQPLELVGLLSLNQAFVKDLTAFRQDLQKYTETPLPLKKIDLALAEGIVGDFCEKGIETYWRGMLTLISKYRLPPYIFWPPAPYIEASYGDMVFDRPRELLQDKIDVHLKKYGRDLRAQSLVRRIDDELSVLESLICFNKPLVGRSAPAWYRYLLAAYSKASTDIATCEISNIGVPYVTMRFPLWASAEEMMVIVKKLYPSFLKERKKVFPLLDRKRVSKPELANNLLAYSVFVESGSYAKATLALEVALRKKSIDMRSVKRSIIRMHKDISERFQKRDK